jgi:hypothetical protein
MILVAEAPDRVVARQGAPAAAFLQEVDYGVKNMVDVDITRRGLFAGGFEQWSDDLVTFDTQIAGIGDIGGGGRLAYAEDITLFLNNFKQVLTRWVSIRTDHPGRDCRFGNGHR